MRELFKGFQVGREVFENEARPGHSSTSKTGINIEKIGKLNRCDRWLTIRTFSENVMDSCVHTALHDKKCLVKLNMYNIPVLDHRLYSPDLASSDFHLFPKLKSAFI